MLRGRVRTDAIPDPPAPGWPALYKTVREADVNKVEDCREDIDTLLVFAGLYSAVLTAFVIESYTHLQQDPQDVIIDLLQQIATRNYISGPGFINSTITSTPPPPFEAPLWAIRVNVLWFTSLLLSLASASFGILVKQWLREYLAIEYTVPQQRLRARQYRYPALAQWRVFEIAAFLPLLLQLSLGLFFAGLCFFTAAVHSSVGRTTTPLVCAWAFLLFVTTVAPLFSPRCPFKTTFLKRSLKSARRHGPLVVTSLGRFLIFLLTVPLFYPVIVPIIVTINLVCDYRAVSDRVTAAARDIHKYISQGLTRFSAETSSGGRAVGVWLHSDLYDCIDDIPWKLMKYLAIGVWWLVAVPYQVVAKIMGVPKNEDSTEAGAVEEEDVVKKEGEDVEILLSVDALMSDDGLLPSMLDAVQQQAGASPKHLINFVVQMVKQRNERSTVRGNVMVLPDLCVLSKFAISTVTKSLIDTIRSGNLSAVGANGSSPAWVFIAIFILHSHSQPDRSDLADIFRKMIIVPRMTLGHSCTGGIPIHQCFTTVASAGTHDDSSTADPAACLRCILDTYKGLLCHYPAHSHSSLNHLLGTHATEDSFTTLSKGLLKDLFDVLTSSLLGSISSQKDLADIPGSHEALHIILQYSEKFGRREDAVKLCHRMLLTESGTRMLLVQFAALHTQCRVSEDVREVLLAVDGLTALEDNNRIRSHFTAACERFCNGGDDGDDDVPLDYVRLCAAFIPWSLGDYQIARAVAKAIEKYYRTRGWRKELQRPGPDYWYSDAPSPTSDELFTEDRDLACETLRRYYNIPTELINALWLFVPEERGEEILRSIREHGNPNYAPTTRPAPSTGLDEADNGQDGTNTAEGEQEVGDAGQEGPESMGQDAGRADAEDAEASGGAYLDAVAVPGGDEGTADQDATESEAVGEGAAEDGGDLAGGGGTQGMLAMAGN